MTKLKYLILCRAHMTISEVAQQIGRSRQAISNACNGKGCGRKTAEELIAWSGDILTYEEIYRAPVYTQKTLDIMFSGEDQGQNGTKRDDTKAA